MAVFSWTASPGFFAVMGKAARHYQRTGSSYILGYPEPFWIIQWVNDIVIIEVDIGDRLAQAERRLRDAIKLVFGSDGWHEGKFTTWSRCFHAVGIDWNTSDMTVTIPQRKVDKVKQIVAETMQLKYIPKKRLDSLIGVLRHVVTFIPTAKPLTQRLVSVQRALSNADWSGVHMSTTLLGDLKW
ncbi:hypothetical protein PHYSODRAFT_362027 [Phytophthora sojae]|uniref:Reverse transcriptase domain-containing protein n=1 Tax=Phytophthora sojae (strain P6497) TaxID=1094619 RepID=G5A6N4_PHYSP|nr:hypothetical protein PHYSODRAFT_362027 [Phytophthora sojae]EGZ08989.1 hypothetical protein PHYSODRAFT_362027 [Phytophthora sojae]|eukprot:XP_009535622.1 hypothetical protein PHYSODRAFT_362027 [Phytophthora sojae]